jgi:hypothetical protein
MCAGVPALSPKSRDLLDIFGCIVFALIVVAGTVAFLRWSVSWT